MLYIKKSTNSTLKIDEIRFLNSLEEIPLLALSIVGTGPSKIIMGDLALFTKVNIPRESEICHFR